MANNRSFARDEIFPAYFVNRIQDFIGGADANFQLSLMNATTIQVAAGAGDAQAAIGITGKWRYVTASILRAHPGGAAGVYQVFVVAADNSIASTPLPNTDNTDYSFDLRILAGSATPTGVALFRSVGELTWDGSAVTSLRQTVGGRANVGSLQPTSSVASEVPVSAAGVAGQTAPLFAGAATRGGIRVFSVGVSGAVDGSAYSVGGVALASTHLSDTAALARLSGPVFTGVPTAPTAAVDTNSTQLATTAFVVGQAAAVSPLVNGPVAVGVSLRYARADHVHPTDQTRAPLASPSFTGVPAAPTASPSTNTTQVATTAFVSAAVAASQPVGVAYLADNQSFTGVNTFTVCPIVPTAAADTSTTVVASTAFVLGQAGAGVPLVNGAAVAGVSLRYSRQDHVHPTDASRAPLASPALTGTPTAPTASAATNSTQIASTAYVTAAVAASTPTGVAYLANAQTFTAVNTFSLSPIAPTPPDGDNTTKVATTAFVLTNGGNVGTFTVGDGSATSIDVTHSFNSKSLGVSVRAASAPFDEVYPRVEFPTTSTVRLIFDVAPTTGEFSVAIFGKGGTAQTISAHATTHNPGGSDTLDYAAVATAVGVSALTSRVTVLEASLGVFNVQTGTAYTLVLADGGLTVTMANAAASTLTVPPNSSVAFPVGTVIDVIQEGAGQVTVAAGAGVTLRSYQTKVKIAGQFAAATLEKRATDTWALVGNLA